MHRQLEFVYCKYTSNCFVINCDTFLATIRILKNVHRNGKATGVLRSLVLAKESP